MEENDFTLYLSSNDSTITNTLNTPTKFSIYLKREFRLKGNWKVCLRDISYYRRKEEATFDNICVLCDIVKQSFIFNSFLPVLSRVPTLKPYGKESILIDRPHYVDIIRSQFEHIDITLTDEKLKLVILDNPVYLTLHFKRG